jgi:TolB-like protein
MKKLFKVSIFFVLLATSYLNAKSLHNSGDIERTDALTEVIELLSDGLVSSIRADKATLGSIAITSFVQLDKLETTSHFGRVLGESFFSKLHSLGLQLLDFRGQKGLSINNDGEFFITRDVKKLNYSIANKYILVGTYSTINDEVLINTRIIDNIDGTIISASSVIYETDDCKILDNCPKAIIPRTINIVTGD